MWYVIISIIVVLAILGIIFISIYNRFQIIFIKIDEAENNIDILLDKKLDLLTRIANVLESELKDDETNFMDIQKLHNKKLTHFQMRDALSKKSSELDEIFDRHRDLDHIEGLNDLLDEMDDSNTDLNAAIKYYNDNVVLYQKLLRCFPSNLLALVFHYHDKEYYQDEKEEMFEILKK